jgi:hypothetical protein
MATALSAFSPYVQPDVAGAPLLMVEDAILDGCRRFALDTWLLTSDVTIPTVAGTQSYTVTAAALTEIIGVKTISIDGASPIEPVPEDTSKRYVQADGDPTCFWFKNSLLWMYPTPESVLSMAVEAIIRPTTAATTVDDKFVEYREAIAAWAKYTLMSMVGQSWSNPQEAEYFYKIYARRVGEEKMRDNTGRVAADLRVRPNFF